MWDLTHENLQSRQLLAIHQLVREAKHQLVGAQNL